MATTKKRRIAAPDIFSGHNPNVPIRMYDTHPNKRFYLGDLVMSLDPERPPMGGVVIGHVAEDRVTVQWGDGRLITQEDVEEVIPIREQAGKQDADKNITTFDSPWIPENQRKQELDKLKQQLDEMKEQLEKKQDKPPEEQEGGEEKKEEGGKKASRRREMTASHDSLFSDKRKNGLIILNRVANYLHQEGLPLASSQLRKASSVAAALHQLYVNPRTRTASADHIAIKAMGGAINIALRVAKHLRSLKPYKMKKVGNLVDVAMHDALLYPRQPSRIRQAASSEEQTFGNKALNSMELYGKMVRDQVKKERETKPQKDDSGQRMQEGKQRDYQMLQQWMGRIQNPEHKRVLIKAMNAIIGRTNPKDPPVRQDITFLQQWAKRVQDPQFRAVLMRSINALMSRLGMKVSSRKAR